MKTVAIISQKGGAGKSTFAINLAVTAHMLGHRSAIIDIDPQGSAKKWYEARESNDPPVISAQSISLPELLETSKNNGADIVFIDTSPHAQAESLAAARIADFVIIPCQPSFLDLASFSTTADLISISKTPAAIVLNLVPPTGKLVQQQSRAVLEQFHIPVSQLSLANRVDFKHSLAAGCSVMEYNPLSKASTEIKNLYDWTFEQTNTNLINRERIIA